MIMSVGIVGICDRLEYNTTDVSTLNKNLVKAFKANNTEEIQNIIKVGIPMTVDVFIAINKHSHPCILVVPAGDHSVYKYIQHKTENSFDVPDDLLCWQFDLCLEGLELKKYRLSKNFNAFKVLKESIVEKSYFMGTYKDVSSCLCFELAVLQAAPYHYSAILADCDEFTKKFCTCLVAYCSNSKEMETIVKESIQKVSAKGLIVEHLSKSIITSRFSGNFIAGVTHVTNYFSENYLVASAVTFLLIYPVAISLFVLYIHANHI